MASGVKIDDELLVEYTKLKKDKSLSYILLHITDEYKSIKVSDRGEKGDKYEEFLAKLMDSENNRQNRYGIYDFGYEKNNQDKSKILYIAWNPDNAKIKEKMVYASSRQALSEALGQVKFRQVSSISELDRDTVLQEVLKDDRVDF